MKASLYLQHDSACGIWFSEETVLFLKTKKKHDLWYSKKQKFLRQLKLDVNLSSATH